MIANLCYRKNDICYGQGKTMSFLSKRLGLTRYEADEYYQLALDAYNRKKFDDAHENLGYAIELLPHRAEFYAARGFFHLEDGEPDEAREDFEEALKRNQYEMLAHYGLGILAYQDSEWDEAIERFRRARAADMNRPESAYYLALAYHRKRDNLNAEREMRAAVALFARINDGKRARYAERWLGEIEKLAQEQRERATAQLTSTN